MLSRKPLPAHLGLLVTMAEFWFKLVRHAEATERCRGDQEEGVQRNARPIVGTTCGRAALIQLKGLLPERLQQNPREGFRRRRALSFEKLFRAPVYLSAPSPRRPHRNGFKIQFMKFNLMCRWIATYMSLTVSPFP